MTFYTTIIWMFYASRTYFKHFKKNVFLFKRISPILTPYYKKDEYGDRKEIIKQMGDEMREDIFLEVNNRIERSLRRRFWLRISAVAASVTLLFGISNYISFHEGYKKLNSQMVEMVNPMGMRSSVVLSDGTKVILNAGTTLSYPTAFVSGQREVKVNGEAFFEVSHDKEHPFIVSAENVKVKVLGTKFNVKAYDDDDNIEVTLAEGKVGVGLDTKNLIQIMPGQQIKYMKASHRFIKREVRLQRLYFVDLW